MNTQALALRDEAAAERAALATQRRQLKAAQARLQVLQDQTEALIASQKATYSKLKYDAAKAAAVLAAQKKSDAALGSLIDRLIAQKKVVYGIPSGYSGSLRWPMPGSLCSSATRRPSGAGPSLLI